MKNQGQQRSPNPRCKAHLDSLSRGSRRKTSASLVIENAASTPSLRGFGLRFQSTILEPQIAIRWRRCRGTTERKMRVCLWPIWMDATSRMDRGKVATNVNGFEIQKEIRKRRIIKPGCHGDEGTMVAIEMRELGCGGDEKTWFSWNCCSVAWVIRVCWSFESRLWLGGAAR